jgi:hypothetical protein
MKDAGNPFFFIENLSMPCDLCGNSFLIEKEVIYGFEGYADNIRLGIPGRVRG